MTRSFQVPFADAIRKGLSAEGYDVSVARTGDEGWRKLSTEAFALVVLDWMLPGRDGIELLTDLGGLERRPPVLLLTARDAVEDRVMGLDHGADDYMVKPFAFVELLARMRALLRRSGAPDIVQQRVGSITADIRSRRVWRRDIEAEASLSSSKIRCGWAWSMESSTTTLR